MANNKRLPVVFILVFFLLSAVDGYFDCRRQGMSCVAGGCNLIDGNCVCPPGVNGTDCSYQASSVSDTACMPRCENGGTCLAESTGSRCYCPEMYTGDLCEKRRAMVVCSGTTMTITVTPFSGFKGIVYVNEHQNDDNCTFNKRGRGNGTYYENTFDLETGCGALQRNNTPEEGDVTFEREIIIQYNPDMHTALDQFLNVSCIHKNDNITTLSSNVGNLLIEHRGNLTKDDTESVFTPVKLEIQTRTGEKVHGPVYVGRPLRLYFYLADLSVYDNLRVEECVATNGRKQSYEKSETLIKSSCCLPTAYQIVRGEMEQDEKNGVILNFDVFKFVDSNIIQFQCNVRVCKPGDSLCKPKNCQGELNGYGRRKRESSSAADDQVTVTDRLYVTDLVAGQSAVPVSTPKAHECLQLSEILNAIIILCCAVFILMLACCILTVCVFRIKRQSKTKLAMKNSQTEVSSTITSGSSERMRIPRIRSIY